MRRNLSGIFIFDRFEDEEKRQPTCFEDCSKETQKKWLETLDKEALKKLAIALGETIKEIGDTFDLIKD